MSDQDKLAELEAQFEAQGGRGVELADEIDRLRRKLNPDPKVETIHIKLGPEAVAFYSAIHEAVNDPRLRTQDLLVQLDTEITGVFDAGYPTSDMTEILDELWDHLREQGATLPISDERLKEIRERAE